ncbi:MAG: pantoate--beta-alanine ligase [Thermoanaerobaculia bacterium]
MILSGDPLVVRQTRRSWKGSVGLVPTMGALHAGHLSLVRRARAENAHVVASLFVNPIQFAPTEDFARYPRPRERDLALLAAEGIDLVFAPEAAALYPPGFATWVVPGPQGDLLEGARRPGHFRGVLTVVAKLLHAVEPDRAYFGQKDAQQAVLIRQMASDLDIPVGIVVCPIVREADGLAMSSRNAYLTAEERRAAPVLHRALSAAAAAHATGERSAEALRRVVRDAVAGERLAVLDYVSVADPATLVELESVEGRALLSLVVRFGATRLLDNVVLPTGESL